MFEHLHGYGASRDNALKQKVVEEQVVQGKSYNMAQVDRLTADWVAFVRSFNFDIAAGGMRMLARARELFENDPYTKKLVGEKKKGIVGPKGFTLRNKAGEFIIQDGTLKFVKDKVANGIINEAFWQYSKNKYCTIEADETFRKHCGTLVQTVMVDGEVFIKKLPGAKHNEFGFTTQTITSEYCDWKLNRELPNGNFIVMGIEVTPGWKKVAYWFRKHNARTEVQYGYNWTRNYERITADKIIHLFIKETVHQLRGITLLAPAGIRLKMLYGFEEAALVNSRATANIPWAIEKQKDAMAPPDPLQGQSKDSDGNIIEEIEKGQIYKVADGYTAKTLHGEYPHPLHPSFVKSNLRAVAGGSDIGYSTISGDYESVTWHSGKLEKQNEQDAFKEGQSWFEEDYLWEIFTSWLEMAMLAGKLKFPNGKLLPAEKFKKFNAPVFHGRTWEYTDPKKERESNIIALQTGEKTFEQLYAERGIDLEEQLDAMAEQREMFKSRGLDEIWNLIMTKYKVQDSSIDDIVEGNNGNGKAHLIKQ